MADNKFNELIDDVDMIKAGLDLMRIAIREQDPHKEVRIRCEDLQIMTAEVLKKLELYVRKD